LFSLHEPLSGCLSSDSGSQFLATSCPMTVLSNDICSYDDLVMVQESRQQHLELARPDLSMICINMSHDACMTTAASQKRLLVGASLSVFHVNVSSVLLVTF
jgi:hypothetical protein